MSLYDLGFRCRPIDQWPGEFTKDRRRPPFGRAQWGGTIQLLAHELRQLRVKGSRSFLIAARSEDILLDGSRPKSGARVEHPGVILSFDSRFGPLKYACDMFTDWQANVRAIALGLEALRKVERYGISRRGEQYHGYKQIAGAVAAMSPDVGANILERWSGIPAAAIRSSAEVLEAAFKIAAKKTHPDVAGGSATDFRAVEEARRILGGNTE